jgi:hypothetical protein
VNLGIDLDEISGYLAEVPIQIELIKDLRMLDLLHVDFLLYFAE